MKTRHTKWMDVYHATFELEIIHKDTVLIKKGITVAAIQVDPHKNLEHLSENQNADFLRSHATRITRWAARAPLMDALGKPNTNQAVCIVTTPLANVSHIMEP
jgi:hypothetical protein